MASLNPFRRSRKPEVLVASAQLVDLNNTSSIDAVLKYQGEKWYEKAFDADDACGEIHDGVESVANLVSRIRIFGAEQPSARDAIPQRSTDEAVVATVDRLGSVTDVSTLLFDLATQMTLIGDCNLVGLQSAEDVGDIRDNPVEKWLIASVAETSKATYTFNGERRDTIRLEGFKDDKDLILRPDAGDTFIRLYRRSRRKRNLATSHIRPLLPHVEELLWWDAAAVAAAQSRVTLAGLIGVPSNLELPPEAEDEIALSGSQRFIKRLMKVISANIRNPGGASGAAPFVFSYPWNEKGVSGVETISLDRPADELLEARTDRALRRIAQGFPLPPEFFFGLGTANDWSGLTITQDKFSQYIEPFVVFLMASLTEGWLRPILRELKASGEFAGDPETFMLWYDASALIHHPDMGQAADKGVEYGALSLEGWRRIRNIPESDAPTPEEKADILEWLRGLRGRDQTALQLTDDPTRPGDKSDMPDEPEGHAPEDLPATPLRRKGQQQERNEGRRISASANGNGDGSNNNGEAFILVPRLQVYCDMSIRRALERANNKLRSRANKNPSYASSLRGVSTFSVASTLGKEAVTKLGSDDLFADSFSDAPRRIHSLCAGAVELTPSSSSLVRTYLAEHAASHLYTAPTDDLLITEDDIISLIRSLATSPATV